MRGLAMRANAEGAARRLLPHLAIEHAIVDGFLDVDSLDRFAGFEVGDGSRDAEHFVMGAGGQAEFIHAVTQEFLAVGFEPAVSPDLTGCHVGVFADP